MAKCPIIFLLLVALVLAIACPPPEQSCGQNAEFTFCGTACPAKCNAPISHILCIERCVVGCQCKPGYMLNNNNECVCPAQCQKGIWNRYPEELQSQNESLS